MKSRRRGNADAFARFGARLPGTRHRVVTMHPLADEPELLERLALSANDCNSVDIWWLHKGLLLFINIDSCRVWGPECRPGIRYWRNYTHKHGRKFVVKTDTIPLTTGVVHHVMNVLSSWVALNAKDVFGRVAGADEFHRTVLDADPMAMKRAY